MRSATPLSRMWSAWFAMALMAVVVRAMIPAGFMVTPESGLNLVICTGHGPSLLAGKSDTPTQSPQKPDSPCAFAGFQAGCAVETFAVVTEATVWFAALPVIRSFDLLPGRGLTAPPPPSTGPPTFH